MRYETYKHQEIALHLVDLADIRSRAGDYKGSLKLTEAATEILDSSDYLQVSWLRYSIAKRQAMALVAQGDIGAAYTLMKPVAEKIKTGDASGYVNRFRKDFNRLFLNALVNPKKEDLNDIQVTRAAYRKSLGDKHHNTAVLTAIEGIYYAQEGKYTEAVSLFEESFDALSIHSRRTQSEGESNLFDQKRQVYIAEQYLESLMAIAVSAQGREVEGFVERAFSVASNARGRIVAELMSSSAARVHFDDPELKELARREQDAQRQIQVLYGLFAEAVNNETPDDKLKKLRSDIDNLRVSRAAIFQQLEKRYPHYSSLINPPAVNSKEIAGILKPMRRCFHFILWIMSRMFF